MLTRNTKNIRWLIFFFAWLSGGQIEAAEEWSYEGSTAPEHWASVSPDFRDCGGKNQSPVDLNNLINTRLPAIKFSYQSDAQRILNNGHSIVVEYAPGSYILVNDERFDLQQLHFHAPSEHLIQGQSFPAEIHFVHTNEAGQLAVVGVMIQEAEENAMLTELWTQLPRQKQQRWQVMAGVISAEDLLPAKRAYYRLNGSLTTPPCPEGVLWLVMKRSIDASPGQIKTLTEALGHPNNRPVQPLNARIVLQ